MLMRTKRNGHTEWLPDKPCRMAYWNPTAGTLTLSGPGPDSGGKVVARCYKAPPGWEGRPHKVVRAWMTYARLPFHPWRRAI